MIVAMQAWVAVKRGPLFLWRDPTTHVSHYRFDRAWFLPEWLKQTHALHTEVVILAPCRGAHCCIICAAHVGNEKQVDGSHYLSYTVDSLKNEVYYTVGRHIKSAPVTLPGSGESWVYYRIPMSPRQLEDAFRFLERQLGKPFGGVSRAYWRFDKKLGAKYEDAATGFVDVQSWNCSELTSAMLLLCWPGFDSDSEYIIDPALTSPCRLESMLKRSTGVEQASCLALLPVVARKL